MSDKPKTKKDFFAQLDEMLSKEDKKAIMTAEDTFVFHFGLGLWIRNNWLYGISEEKTESICRAFGLDPMLCQADDISSEIIEEYQKYLKRKDENSN